MLNEMHQDVLMESKTARENALQNVSDERMDDLFLRVKGLALLPDDIHVTTEMVANYYEVDKKLIEYHLKESKDEVLSDGVKTIKGEELKDFKILLTDQAGLGQSYVDKRANALTLIPRRAILRLGMLIQKSDIAKQVRTYLLNVEENSSSNIRLISISQDTNNMINMILTENEEMKTMVYNIINKVDELLEQPLFKIYENSSSAYEKLLMEFTEMMKEKKLYNGNYVIDYAFFNKNFKNWTGVDFGNKKINNKNYWITYYGIDAIKHFVYGIKQGKIVKNKNGNWVDLNGVFNNKVEWKKILDSFEHECAYCGSDGILVAEHLLCKRHPKSTDRIYNIVPACQDCNCSKGEFDLKEWYFKQSFYSKDRIMAIRNHYVEYK